MVPHPNYWDISVPQDVSVMFFDIAVVNIREPDRQLWMDRSIYPVQILWDSSVLQDGTELFVLGVGGTEPGREDSYPDIVQNATFHKVDTGACSRMIFEGALEGRNLCLEGTIGQACCPGDSGGPVLLHAEDDFTTNWVPHLTAIVVLREIQGRGFIERNCLPWHASMALHIGPHQGWIESVVGSEKVW